MIGPVRPIPASIALATQQANATNAAIQLLTRAAAELADALFAATKNPAYKVIASAEKRAGQTSQRDLQQILSDIEAVGAAFGS